MMNRCVAWVTKKIAVCLSVMMVLAAGSWSLPVMATNTENQETTGTSATWEEEKQSLEEQIAQLSGEVSAAKTGMILGIIGSVLAVLALAGASVALFVGMKQPSEKELIDPEKFASKEDLNALSQNVARQIDMMKTESSRNIHMAERKQEPVREEKKWFETAEEVPVTPAVPVTDPQTVKPKTTFVTPVEEVEPMTEARIVKKLCSNFDPQIQDRIWLTEGEGYLLYDDNTLEPDERRGSNTLENFAQNGLLRLFDAQVDGQVYTYRQIVDGEYPRKQYYQPGKVLKKAVVKQESGGEYSLVQQGRIEMLP